MTQREALRDIATYILPVKKIDGVEYVEYLYADHLRDIAKKALKIKKA